ncbi:hypothetical protein MNBD_ACTINO02-2304 [hydrothermal vent metagenome]|uniref:SLH domain-containing protein n=1 Tax=hydrothermal vent metagenome TaxID=652676 RepID=A0A3B0RLJ1_9ZZZZ
MVELGLSPIDAQIWEYRAMDNTPTVVRLAIAAPLAFAVTIALPVGAAESTLPMSDPETTGITLGCNPPDNDRFCPDNVVTREQMAAFLQRALAP